MGNNVSITSILTYIQVKLTLLVITGTLEPAPPEVGFKRTCCNVATVERALQVGPARVLIKPASVAVDTGERSAKVIGSIPIIAFSLSMILHHLFHQNICCLCLGPPRKREC